MFDGCETLFIEERTDTCGKTINAVKHMEPRWDLSGDCLLFGDLKVMQSLLNSTGLECCLLRGDLWHLMNEVWPYRSSFCKSAFEKIDNFLQLVMVMYV
jgi:hypothetical protein